MLWRDCRSWNTSRQISLFEYLETICGSIRFVHETVNVDGVQKQPNELNFFVSTMYLCLTDYIKANGDDTGAGCVDFAAFEAMRRHKQALSPPQPTRRAFNFHHIETGDCLSY